MVISIDVFTDLEISHLVKLHVYLAAFMLGIKWQCTDSLRFIGSSGWFIIDVLAARARALGATEDVACCRPIAAHEVEKKQSALRYVRIETAVALACSFLINLFIVSVFAKVCKP